MDVFLDVRGRLDGRSIPSVLAPTSWQCDTDSQKVPAVMRLVSSRFSDFACRTKLKILKHLDVRYPQTHFICWHSRGQRGIGT